MKAFIVHHAFKHISIYYTYLVTCTYETRFSQFQENIFVSRKNKIYNRNKIQNKNKIHDVEMKSTTADRKGVRRKMSQDSWHVAKLGHNQCSFASVRLGKLRY